MTVPISADTFPLNGREIPRIGYGMGQVTRQAGSEQGRRDAVSLLRRAYDLGVRQFDSAQFYGNGLANDLIRQALGDHRDEITIATKIGARPVADGPAPMTMAQRPHELRGAVEANLRTLGTDRLDVAYLRRADFKPGLIAEGDQQVPLADQLAEMVELRQEGKIVGIGLSHVRQDQLDQALSAGIVAVQNIYFLLGRQDEPLLEVCRDNGIAWIPYFPLGGGGAYFGLPKVVDDPVVQAVASQVGATPSQVGQAWQLQHNPTTMIVSGTGNPAHLEENVAAAAVRLSDEQMARLDALAA